MIGKKPSEHQMSIFDVALESFIDMNHELLKSIYNLSDEGVVARWLENPYMQYFTGEKVFQKRPPMNPIDMT